MLRYCHKENICSTTWSPVFSYRVSNMALWLRVSLTRFSMLIINTVLTLQMLGALVISWQEGFHDRHRSCFRPCVPNNLSCDAPSWRPTPHFSTSETQVQISTSSQWSFYYKRIGQWFPWSTRVVDGEILAGWGVISRSPFWRIFVLFGPVITNESRLASSGARTHSNNTAEMIAMIEALSFLGPRGLVTPDEQSRIFFDSMHAAGICLGTIQARTHVQLALACQQSMIRVQHRPRLTMQHVYGHSGNLGTNALTTPLPLAHLGSSRAMMPPHARFVVTLTLLYVSMSATASVKHLNDCSTFEQTLRRHTKTGFSIGSIHRVPCVQCALFVCSCHVFHLLSARLFCFLWIITLSTSDGPSIFIHVYRIEYRRLFRAQYVESSIGIALLRACEWYCRLLPRGPRLGQDRIILSLCS